MNSISNTAAGPAPDSSPEEIRKDKKEKEKEKKKKKKRKKKKKKNSQVLALGGQIYVATS